MKELYKKVCEVSNLFSSWEIVKSKSASAGIDNVTIKRFESNLEENIFELHEQLKSFRYVPEPYKEIKIPKNNNEFRYLSLSTVKDKIVQQAIKNVIEPILDRNLLDVSYAYRKNKGPLRAVRRTRHLIKYENREWVTLCDIDDFFDSISHDVLFSMLSKIIEDPDLLRL